MKRKIAAGFLLCSALFLTACGQANDTVPSSGSSAVESSRSSSADTEAYHKIDAEEAKKMMEAGGVTVVDVRTAEEYAGAHIEGAILLPVETIGEEQPEELPDPDAAILVYCRTGKRSKAASEQLVALGYQNINDFGGIVDWPYETVSEEA
ncbi:rhodanese-like domain-containing protein [Anaeromassilibacillus senegalensis]|uniref:rhodanese-like domain-containing protein n=1 Tax=Anaeromassilibacillus senegalensis TaxID=1673717 RepID=UPI000A5F24F7|nr:rhodanese-like domain-containing protein [Anaeromassilibacillus senegalensis]